MTSNARAARPGTLEEPHDARRARARRGVARRRRRRRRRRVGPRLRRARVGARARGRSRAQPRDVGEVRRRVLGQPPERGLGRSRAQPRDVGAVRRNIQGQPPHRAGSNLKHNSKGKQNSKTGKENCGGYFHPARPRPARVAEFVLQGQSPMEQHNKHKKDKETQHSWRFSLGFLGASCFSGFLVSPFCVRGVRVVWSASFEWRCFVARQLANKNKHGTRDLRRLLSY